MQTIGTVIEMTFLKVVNREIDKITLQMANGSLKNYESYKQLVGELRTLGRIPALLEEAHGIVEGTIKYEE
jgi:hypothetical protein